MNCASAGVIMQLLSPQDWLDGIQAALLVITIFPVFATLFVTPSKIYISLELCQNSMEPSQCDSLKRVKTEALETLFISEHLEKLYPTLVIKFPEKELKYGKIWSMSPNSELGHLKAHFFTASFVWRFRFVIFIVRRPSSPPTLSSIARKRRCMWCLVALDMAKIENLFPYAINFFDNPLKPIVWPSVTVWLLAAQSILTH